MLTHADPQDPLNVTDLTRWQDVAPAVLNPSGIEPIGGHLLVTVEKSDTEKRMGAMGLVMSGDAVERDRLAMQGAKIVAVAPDARFGLADHVGSVALFGRYAGATFEGADKETYRILFDEDVKGVMGRG